MFGIFGIFYSSLFSWTRAQLLCACCVTRYLYLERKPSVHKSETNLFPDTDEGEASSSKKDRSGDDEAKDEEMGEESASDPDAKNRAEEISLETTTLSEDIVTNKKGEESKDSIEDSGSCLPEKDGKESADGDSSEMEIAKEG